MGSSTHAHADKHTEKKGMNNKCAKQTNECKIVKELVSVGSRLKNVLLMKAAIVSADAVGCTTSCPISCDSCGKAGANWYENTNGGLRQYSHIGFGRKCFCRYFTKFLGFAMFHSSRLHLSAEPTHKHTHTMRA